MDKFERLEELECVINGLRAWAESSQKMIGNPGYKKAALFVLSILPTEKQS